MKALKLILLFLVILGAVVGIFYLVTLPPKIVELPPIDDETREEYRQKFEYEWQGAGDWDENIFMQHLEELNQLSADYSVEDLRTFDRRTITEIISQKIFGEWEKGDCKKAEIDKYIKAVDIICNNNSDAKTDPDIKLIKEVNVTYRAALKLADKKIGLAPTFNGTKWNSYTDYSNSIKKEKKNIEDNNLTKKQY